MNGKLIVLEGLDGTGKSTQLELLRRSEDFSDFLFISFPDYESLSGRIISKYLTGEINEENDYCSAYSASGFYAVDRYLNYKSKWEKEIKSGKNIIAARYVTSNAVYQTAKLPRSCWEEYIEWLYDYEYGKLGLPRPDLVIYLEMPLDISRKLLAQRSLGSESRDIHEENASYMERCREAADFVALQDNWKKISCTNGEALRERQDLFSEIAVVIKQYLPSSEF